MATTKTNTRTENLKGYDHAPKGDQIMATTHFKEERHSEELHDIIAKVPSWLLRWGILLFFFILFILASISVVIRYPDTIKTRIRFQATESAYLVTAGTAGVIHQVMTQQGAVVAKGQPLAFIRTLKEQILTIRAPANGRTGSSLLLQPGTPVSSNEPVFIIHPINEDFYGIIQLPITTDGVRTGQRVLINLQGFPEKEYGQLQGRISYIAGEPGKDGSFTTKVTLDRSHLKRPMPIREWMS